MSKICYINNYKEQSGYSEAGRGYIQALDSIGASVVPRYVKMTNSTTDIPQRIKELEESDLNGVTAVIQHNLPNTWSYKAGVQNIGAFAFESELEYTSWAPYIELMDKIVVFCEEDRKRVVKLVPSKVGSTYIVPHAVNVNKFSLEYPKNTFGLPEDCIKFYTVAECNERKNLEALIIAYYCAFSSSDNVALIIKTNNENIKQFINEKKKTLRRFTNIEYYPKILLISDQISEFDLNTIHYNADIFVSTSRGESWCLPAIDAFGFGNRVIAPAAGSFLDYASYGVGVHLVGTMLSYCDRAQSLDFLYTGNQTWNNINNVELTGWMKELANQNNTKAIWNWQTLKDNLSFEAVGRILKGIIDAK